MKRLVLACVAMVMPCSYAATIDFESVVNPSVNQNYTNLDTQGFTLTGMFHVVDDPTACDFGGCVLSSGQYGAVVGPNLDTPITLTADSGLPFTLVSFSASMLFNDSSAANSGGFPNGDTINILGNLSGGGTVMASLPLGSGFGPYTLSGFENLSSVVFSASVTGGTTDASFAIDDVTTTPEPSTMSLLAGSAVVGLLLKRRLRRS